MAVKHPELRAMAREISDVLIDVVLKVGDIGIAEVIIESEEISKKGRGTAELIGLVSQSRESSNRQSMFILKPQIIPKKVFNHMTRPKK